ncbi:swr1 complex component [Quaeritorhiza haematococci]|nr:swr1 complex component [Quaeritorhiza haematococci]
MRRAWIKSEGGEGGSGTDAMALGKEVESAASEPAQATDGGSHVTKERSVSGVNGKKKRKGMKLAGFSSPMKTDRNVGGEKDAQDRNEGERVEKEDRAVTVQKENDGTASAGTEGGDGENMDVEAMRTDKPEEENQPPTPAPAPPPESSLVSTNEEVDDHRNHIEDHHDDRHQEEEENAPGPSSSSGAEAVAPASASEGASESEKEEKEMDTDMAPVPFLLKHSLREYQHVGMDWLVGLYRKGLNGILADEMGLGKTIQTIALVAHLACVEGIWGPHLVVVPTSVMLNWEYEFKKWCPGFKILTYYGNPKERKEKRQGWSKQNAFHVCITSYQMVLQDHTIFRRKQWQYLILDEAHNIKNFRSQRWQTLLTFSSERRLLLTGTPLQNNLMELWSLLYFLMPSGAGVSSMPVGFATMKEFQEWFSNPVDKIIESTAGSGVGAGAAGGVDGAGETIVDQETRDTIQKLHTVLRPYLLRRLKKDVEKQMPAKYEHVVYCRLSKRQRFLYDDFMSRAKTRQDLASGNYLSILNCLMQLRKVCNHPDLFEVREIMTSFVMDAGVVGRFGGKAEAVWRKLVRCFGAAQTQMGGVAKTRDGGGGEEDEDEDEDEKRGMFELDFGRGWYPRGYVRGGQELDNGIYHDEFRVSELESTSLLRFVDVRREMTTPTYVPDMLRILDCDKEFDAIIETAQKKETDLRILSPVAPDYEHLVQYGKWKKAREAAECTERWERVRMWNQRRCEPFTGVRYGKFGFKTGPGYRVDPEMFVWGDTRITPSAEADTPDFFSAFAGTGLAPAITKNMPSKFGIRASTRLTFGSTQLSLLRTLGRRTIDDIVSLSHQPRQYMSYPDTLRAMVISLPERSEQLDEVFDKFAFVTPKVLVLGPVPGRWALSTFDGPYVPGSGGSADNRQRRFLRDGGGCRGGIGKWIQPTYTFVPPGGRGTLVVSGSAFSRHGTGFGMNAGGGGYARSWYEEGYVSTQPHDLVEQGTDTVLDESSLYTTDFAEYIDKTRPRMAVARPYLDYQIPDASLDAWGGNAFHTSNGTPGLGTPMASSSSRVVSNMGGAVYSQASSSSALQHSSFYSHYPIIAPANPPPDPYHRIRTKLSIAFPDTSLLQYDCGKLQTLDSLLRRLKTEGHRALIFTQMTKMLDILEIFLNMHGHRYLRLDGRTKVEQRQALMDRFNNDPRILVFILSTRSGGVGMNLIGADTVIFYDSDWNPAMDAQAQDRAHRIGQTRDVHIYRLITEHSIEENMLRKANKKRALDSVVIRDGDFTTEYGYGRKVDWRDWLDEGMLGENGGDEEGDKEEYGGEGTVGGDADTPADGVSSANDGTGEGKNGEGQTTRTRRSRKKSAQSGRTGSKDMDWEAALAAAEDEMDVVALQQAKRELASDLVDFEEGPLQQQNPSSPASTRRTHSHGRGGPAASTPGRKTAIGRPDENSADTTGEQNGDDHGLDEETENPEEGEVGVEEEERPRERKIGHVEDYMLKFVIRELGFEDIMDLNDFAVDEDEDEDDEDEENEPSGGAEGPAIVPNLPFMVTSGVGSSQSAGPGVVGGVWAQPIVGTDDDGWC